MYMRSTYTVYIFNVTSVRRLKKTNTVNLINQKLHKLKVTVLHAKINRY